MPRALKTFITNLGFFELAIAAPSMKAALEAWGMSHNAFHRGFAKETGDAKIVAATQARPGVVLKRAVGSQGPFGEDADLPTALPALKPPKIERGSAKKPERKAAKSHAPKSPSSKPEHRAAILSFEKAQAKRARHRAEEDARLEKTRARREDAIAKAESALEDAQAQHERALAALAREQEKLDRRIEKEKQHWDTLRTRLDAAIDGARR